ncbi:hypothetical protein COW95_02710 [Candidatus Peregrinibacteria bacterium CG22_combo_CG10-13_8_21_14_all_49_11]|nr:MAG: hypothetical protein COW95_02710 [Candidatus Peregrinibacteria bacterium CG22_combo_CG10-13_8_21_14_all_49_11]
MQEAQFALHEEIEERHWWFLGRRHILRQMVRAFVPPSCDTVVIDVGCGTGGNIGVLAHAYTTVGIDPSSQAITAAKKRFPKTEFICGYAPQDLGDRMKTANLILLNDVLEHIKDDRAFLVSLISALFPGAGVLITVPADMSLWSQHDESFGHYRRYSHATLAKLWEGLPVTVRLLSSCNTRFYPLIKCVRSVNRYRGHALGAAGTDFHIPPPFMNRILARMFAGEAKHLLALLRGAPVQRKERGASIIALLEVLPSSLP